ncbi:MAG: DUF3515 domain-containing protein [Actinomycetota bacterium]|nr:DUF3515 domain-containing protein [Actinomycetota bacterium]
MAGALSCLGALLAGCAPGSVEVAGPTRGPTRCSALLAAVPRTVDRQQQRPVSPEDVLAAAWGDPAIVLRCGVTAPPALTPSSPCAEVEGVGWFAEQRHDGFRFTTIGRSTNVQVYVPYAYEPAADPLVDLADAIKAHVPERDPCV